MSRGSSRDRTRSRTHSPNADEQIILKLDSSPGSSRKIGEDGVDDGIQIPNFSKEISVDSEEDLINDAVQRYLDNQPKEITEQFLTAPVAATRDSPKNVSPKSILKRRVPDETIKKNTEIRDNSICCHPLVNKIKHIADKTMHKHDNLDQWPNSKCKKQKEEQAIVQLKTSPGSLRRHKFSAIKLGDSDEMSRTLSVDTSPTTKNKREHIYEDIEKNYNIELAKTIQFSPKILEVLIRPLEEYSTTEKQQEFTENQSIAHGSHDPSLFNETEDELDLRPEEHVMESLHRQNANPLQNDLENDTLVLDRESEEPDIEDVIKNQLEEEFGTQETPNTTITEISDYVISKDLSPFSKYVEQEAALEQPKDENIVDTDNKMDWSKSNSDHEYEIIGKPPPNIVFTSPSTEYNPIEAEDDLSSTTSLERKYLQRTSDNEDTYRNTASFADLNDQTAGQASQNDIEDRYFVSTPSTVSRTECDVSTSQVDSSALENLPLKRDSRGNVEFSDSKLQQRFKEQRDKIRNQAGKLKIKLQNIKSRQFSLPEKGKFKLPHMPERPKFSTPDLRKFSLPERPKFKKINISEKLSMGDRKKFSFPDRSKFTIPEFSLFKIPEKAKINFLSLGRKKNESRVDPESTGSSEDVKNITTMDFESKTYPRLFNRKKKSKQLVLSSPTLNRPDTPPPVFNFAKLPSENAPLKHYVSQNTDETVGPREYGNLSRSCSYQNDENQRSVPYTEHNFDEMERECDAENIRFHDSVKGKISNDENTSSLPDVSLSYPECTHVINEINNDEFFVRPKGISRENIEVRQYLNYEIREAFKMPSNTLALMGNDTDKNKDTGGYYKEDADPELYLDEELEKTSNVFIEKDDGYYTFPPVRPSRAKKYKKTLDSVDYIDQSLNTSMQFSDVDIEGNNDLDVIQYHSNIAENFQRQILQNETIPFESKTLPLAPKRKKKSLKSDISFTSLNDIQRPNSSFAEIWKNPDDDDIIVYRTEHEYVIPEPFPAVIEHGPLPPRRRNRSHATSLADDDRTSHGAESLTLDPNLSNADQGYDIYPDARPESPGYATVEKYPPSKIRRSKSRTPPAPRRRKSHSSERKYHTVGTINRDDNLPDRPPRKKSSTSLVTLEIFKRGASCGDITQYAEIYEQELEDVNKDIKSGEIISKMKDRPLPPPPRPPRGPKRSKYLYRNVTHGNSAINIIAHDHVNQIDGTVGEEVNEIEVSTQTDPLPEDIDYELGIEENCDISTCSSLRDGGEEELNIRKSQSELTGSPRSTRPASRSDKSLIPTDPKIQELARNHLGRTSPTVILVERRVSSPTRINEREEIVTEASLTVQPIDIDEDHVPDVPPLPRADIIFPTRQSTISQENTKERSIQKVGGVERVITDVQLDNLETQRLQVRDLDVGRLNVSELQASKIVVSEIEGMTLQVTELDSKTGHISVSGIELSSSVIDEIVKKFTEMATLAIIPPQSSSGSDIPRTFSREEQTQTDEQASSLAENSLRVQGEDRNASTEVISSPVSSVPTETTSPPMRPPPPDLSPLLLSYLQDLSIPPASVYQLRPARERPFTEFIDTQGSAMAPPPPTRRVKRRPMHHSGSSSEENTRKPSPRRMPLSPRSQEPTITEAGAQFIRVCQNTISRTLKNVYNLLMSYMSGNEDKKDVQMAVVIFLVLIAGLIMFGLSDGRTVHHHHWEFFNPPDSNTK